MKKLYFLILIPFLIVNSCEEPQESQTDPTACFTYSPENPKESILVQFANCSENANTYLWDFGDGTTSIEKTPKHVYQETGTFTVQLTASNEGSNNVITQDITVGDGIYISSGTAEQVTKNSAKIKGSLANVSGTNISQHGHIWYTSGQSFSTDLTTKTELGSISSDTDFVSEITGLQANTTYLIRAYATIGDYTIFGDEIYIITLDNVPIVVSSLESPTAIDEITITFNAKQGNQALMGYTGDVYAHAGLITDQSSDSSDWRYVLAEWNENLSYLKMTKGLSDTYTLTIGPNILWYFSCPVNETIQKIAFVFRNEDGTIVGKTMEEGNIFLDITEADQGDIPVLLTTAITNIYNYSALSGGENIDNKLHPVWYKGVCWSTSPSPTYNDNNTSEGYGNESFTSLITGLSPATVYYVKAYATNYAGIGYGDELQFTTNEGGGIDELVGAWQGIDAETVYTPGELSQVVTAINNNQLEVIGLGFGWLLNFWGEEVIDSNYVVIDINLNDGTLNIPEQDYLTTLYGEVEYSYTIYGSGSFDFGTYPTMTIEYELNQDGFLCADWCYNNGYLTTEKFVANLTLDPDGKIIDVKTRRKFDSKPSR